MNRLPVLLAILVLATTFAFAADIAAVSPLDGAVTTSTDRLSFSIATSAVIESCDLIVDGQIAKTTPYGQQLRGRLISYPLVQEDGTHTWHIACTTDDGTVLTTENRTYSYNAQQASEIKVISNGIFRGSFTHEFKFKNTLEQHPVIVPEVASGDFIKVLLSIYPSTITKELFVKQISFRDGTQYMLLTDHNEKYEVFLGQNTTVNISKSQIIVSFSNFQKNKATIIVYPTASAETPAEEPTRDSCRRTSDTS
jgi:hypothetical protein